MEIKVYPFVLSVFSEEDSVAQARSLSAAFKDLKRRHAESRYFTEHVLKPFVSSSSCQPFASSRTNPQVFYELLEEGDHSQSSLWSAIDPSSLSLINSITPDFN